MNVSEILKMPGLNDEEIIQAAAGSSKLANMVKFAKSSGIDIQIIRLPAGCLEACLPVQVGCDG